MLADSSVVQHREWLDVEPAGPIAFPCTTYYLRLWVSLVTYNSPSQRMPSSRRHQHDTKPSFRILNTKSGRVRIACLLISDYGLCDIGFEPLFFFIFHRRHSSIRDQKRKRKEKQMMAASRWPKLPATAENQTNEAPGKETLPSGLVKMTCHKMSCSFPCPLLAFFFSFFLAVV